MISPGSQWQREKASSAVYTFFKSLLLDQNKPHDQAQIQCGRRLPRGDVYKLWAIILTTWPRQHSYIILSSWMSPFVAPSLQRFQKKVLTHTLPFCPNLNKASFSHYVSLNGSDSKESDWKAGNPGLIPRSGRSPGEGNSNPLQYSCLENSMVRRAWRATLQGIAKSQTWLSD